MRQVRLRWHHFTVRIYDADTDEELEVGVIDMASARWLSEANGWEVVEEE